MSSPAALATNAPSFVRIRDVVCADWFSSITTALRRDSRSVQEFGSSAIRPRDPARTDARMPTACRGLRAYNIFDMFQSGQMVRVNLAGLQVGDVLFHAAVTDAVAHVVRQTSESPPKFLVKLVFAFRGITEAEVPADRIRLA
jgi:hypothetical protein